MRVIWPVAGDVGGDKLWVFSVQYMSRCVGAFEYTTWAQLQERGVARLLRSDGVDAGVRAELPTPP